MSQELLNKAFAMKSTQTISWKQVAQKLNDTSTLIRYVLAIYSMVTHTHTHTEWLQHPRACTEVKNNNQEKLIIERWEINRKTYCSRVRPRPYFSMLWNYCGRSCIRMISCLMYIQHQNLKGAEALGRENPDNKQTLYQIHYKKMVEIIQGC